MEIERLKNTIAEMKVLPSELNSRLEIAAKFRKISQTEEQREKNILRKIKQNLWDNNELYSMHIIRAPGGEESKIEAEKKYLKK